MLSPFSSTSRIPLSPPELYTELHFDSDSFQVTCAVHPATYLNKILLGSRQGLLQLWNISTGRHVYTFDGWGSPVACLAQSPAVDVVGAGLEGGAVVVHNIKFDERLMRFQQDWGPVTALSFRTGEGLSWEGWCFENGQGLKRRLVNIN